MVVGFLIGPRCWWCALSSVYSGCGVDTIDQERRMSSQPLLSRPKSPHHTERLAECRGAIWYRLRCGSPKCCSRRLRFFGHICRADPSQDHSRHCTPVLPVCPSTGGEDPAGRDRPGYELLRTIYGHSIWVWRQLNGVRRTEQLGRHSWKRLRRWQAPDDDDDDDECITPVSVPTASQWIIYWELGTTVVIG